MKAIITIAAALITTAPALAQDFPTRPIRMIVPLTPGSGADIAGRIVGKSMTEAWHQPVVVENRPGAGGQIGTQAVIKADPDGYTLLVQSASHAANSAIYKSLPYDPLKDLVDVARLGVTPYVMVTAPRRSLQIAQGADRRGQGQAGQHPVRLRRRRLLHPSRGGIRRRSRRHQDAARALSRLARGDPGRHRRARRVLHGADQHRARPGQRGQARRARHLHQDPRRRAAAGAPLAEQGLPAYDVSLWFGMWAPAGTPPAVVQKLNAQVARSLQNPEVVAQFGKLGISPLPMTPPEFARFVRSEIEVYQRIVKQADIPQQ